MNEMTATGAETERQSRNESRKRRNQKENGCERSTDRKHTTADDAALDKASTAAVLFSFAMTLGRETEMCVCARVCGSISIGGSWICSRCNKLMESKLHLVAAFVSPSACLLSCASSSPSAARTAVASSWS